MKKIRKNCLFFIAAVTLSLWVGCGSQKQNPETERHAFLLEDNLVFIADVPKNWRYVLYPVNDYYYYLNLPNDNEYRCIEFMGEGHEGDGEDDFFTLIASKGKGGRPEEADGLDAVCVPFTFRDGMKGEWESFTWVSEPHYGPGGEVPFYWGNVYSLEGGYHMSLWMLGSEYDENEQVIKDFLESACFRESDLGIDNGKELSERDWLTLHIWNKSIRMSLKVPEGLKISAGDDRCYIYLDENNTIEIYPDEYGGETLERTGDYFYSLNARDFEDTVFEIPDRYGRINYYFPNQYLLVWNVMDEALRGYSKQIVQSMRFE